MRNLCAITRLLPIIASVTLAACQEDAPQSPSIPVKPLEMLSIGGVGPLNAQTPFNLHDITAVFPNLNVAQQTNFTEGQAYPIITVSKDLKLLLTINPELKHEKIFSVMVHDNLIGNQLGVAIGMPFRDVYSYGHTEECAAASEELTGKVLCYAPRVGNILYLFSGKWSGPTNAIPPQEVLGDWKIEAIIWKPPAERAASGK